MTPDFLDKNAASNLSRELAILLAVVGVLALGVGIYLWRPAALFALVPYALLALCPLSMWLMMRFMNMKGKKEQVFSLKSALAGAALSLAVAGGVSAVHAQTAQPMNGMGGMNGGMMQMMNDPVAMCDKMMHAIATDPVMHKKMNDLMRQAMSRSSPKPR